jgi:AcrR family transcriptional regulator
MPKLRAGELKQACLDEAFAIIEECGIENLSLREVARRLGVSHQAPYRHFSSRDHIIAEVLARSFDEFAAFLEDRPPARDSADDLGNMGRLYMDYARLHPLKYRLMFNTPLPDPALHPKMMRRAQRAFSLLRDRLSDMRLNRLHDGTMPSPTLDALFVWSTLHGLSSLLQSSALGTLGLTEFEIRGAIANCMARLGVALTPIEIPQAGSD